jgi:hypothetical protein
MAIKDYRGKQEKVEIHGDAKMIIYLLSYIKNIVKDNWFTVDDIMNFVYLHDEDYTKEDMTNFLNSFWAELLFKRKSEQDENGNTIKYWGYNLRLV